MSEAFEKWWKDSNLRKAGMDRSHAKRIWNAAIGTAEQLVSADTEMENDSQDIAVRMIRELKVK
jgi:hypothetical protein